MKLSEWAKKTGICYRTAWDMFHDKKIPGAYQLATGTIIVPSEESGAEELVVIYARVSSNDQKGDLERQLERLRMYCAGAGLKIHKEVSEIGSGLNGKRKKLLSVLKNPNVKKIVVEHRDRLSRFGVEMLDAALQSSNREIVVVNESESKDDLVQDFVDLATSMCARIYGRRSARNRAKRAVEASK